MRSDLKIKTEYVHKNRNRIWGTFHLSDGTINKFEMTRDNVIAGISWFQWGNTTDKLGVTVDRVEELCNAWIEENDLP